MSGNNNVIKKNYKIEEQSSVKKMPRGPFIIVNSVF